MTGSTTMLEENRGIWPWRGNRWEIWASSKNLGNLSTGHWEGARLGKDLGSGGRDEEREGHAVLGHREWKDGGGVGGSRLMSTKSWTLFQWRSWPHLSLW